MRQLDFSDGRGFVTYLVLNDQDRVDVREIVWKSIQGGVRRLRPENGGPDTV
jgi:hypothetical protein